jgi:stage III sporulation protein AE
MDELISLDSIDGYLLHLDMDISGYLQNFSFSALWQQLLAGDLHLDMQTIFAILGSVFLKELAASAVLLAQLTVLAVICLILTNFKSVFEKNEISVLSRAVVYLLLAAIALGTFSMAISSAKTAIDNMYGFLYALLPVLMPLMAAIGGTSAVALLNPALLFALSVLMGLVRNLIFPMIYFSAILLLISNIAPQFNLRKLAELFKSISIGLLSICSAVFIAFLGISGMAASSVDGLTVKAVKSASGVFIPVIGRSLADALDSVLGTALVLKNVIGVLGAVVLLVVCALPALKIVIQALMYKLAAAIIQPLGEEQLAEVLTGLGNSLMQVFAVMAICSLFFFFVVAIVIGAGNMTMMMR